MKIYRCQVCANDYDFEALVHHLSTNRGCPGTESVTTSCTWHYDACPYNDPDYRQRAGGWTDKTRPCAPIYRVATGRVTRTDSRAEEPRAGSWLTLTPAPPRPKAQAPRLTRSAR